MTDGAKRSWSARRRGRRTRRFVRGADRLARTVIAIGGTGTIIAVAAVGAFLVAVVVPLFVPARAELLALLPAPPTGTDLAGLTVDEYRTIGAAWSTAGALTTFQLADGSVLERHVFDREGTPTAVSCSGPGKIGLIGFADGSIRVFRIAFRPRFLGDEEVPEGMYGMGVGEVARHERGTVERTVEGQFRLQTLVIEPLGKPLHVGDGPVTALHHAASGGELTIAAVVRSPGGPRILLVRAREGQNVMSGAAMLRAAPAIALPEAAGRGEPRFLRVDGTGTTVYAAWADGEAVRFRVPRGGKPSRAEKTDLVPAADRSLTALELLLGGETLIAGDSRGGLTGWYTVPGGEADGRPAGADGRVLVPAKPVAAGGGAAVTAIATATRRRVFAAGFADGAIGVYAVTSERRLLRKRVPETAPVSALTISPKEDAIVALAGGHLLRWRFDPGHPEATVSTLFAPIAYEGYGRKGFAWQSSAGTDDFEPKLSLIPLIFGTVKATFYSMMFGVPLALLAAVYTSEFLDPTWKAWIKPTIEMMASLPSVVLGFLAALVFAPFLEPVVPAVLAGFFTVPAALLAGACAWQFLPPALVRRLERHRILFMMPALPVGLGAAVAVGPRLERWLFGGDLPAWLNGLHAEPPIGGALGGWLIVLLPLAVLAAAVLAARFVAPRQRRWMRAMDRGRGPLVSLGTFLAGSVFAIVLALAAGGLLTALGLDLRRPLPLIGAFADTFDQRNALVVGFVMGFAIIPIIYTLADDALAAVPGHLRTASLATGATPWQTAMRIVVPTATSGLFGAVMIGLGRAVGETMIVLMAAGNTPVMSMNIFEGLRTLSANIAVELPEAPVGGTHYRTLFLAALTLFAITFLVNTLAEAVRLRFRRRADRL